MALYTVVQRVARARMALMSHPSWCLYSGLLMLGTLKVDKNMPTACTNGRDVIIGEGFAEKLDDPELRFLILHENEHKALRQLTTYKFLCDKDLRLANVAMDFVVNIRLQDADGGEGFIKVVEGACIDTKYRGWSTKQVFDDLMKNKPPKGKGGGGKGEGKGTGSGEPQDGDSEGQQSLDQHDVEGANEMDAEEQAKLKHDIESAIRQGGMLAGTRGGNKKGLLDDVLDSQIRWQDVLAEFIKSVTRGRDSSSWSRINRRWVSQGMYLPSTVSETVGGLLIAGDASGSTWSGNQLAGFLGEAKAIIDDVVPDFVDFMWWDTSVQVVTRFTPETYGSMIDVIKAIQGGGGTRPSCITDWLDKQEPKPDYVAAIVLSDGWVGGDWGSWGTLPVLWCLNSKGVTAGTGQTLYVEEASF